ncbi:MAG: hypothetical protein EPO08_07825 [Rhodospirillaceae bacterium]|nr:MAG: hypothetical protein EPO08_07825 [Rhodospirillaceae bacterium]
MSAHSAMICATIGRFFPMALAGSASSRDLIWAIVTFIVGAPKHLASGTATADPEQIRRWRTQWSDANVGLATVLRDDLRCDGPDGDERPTSTQEEGWLHKMTLPQGRFPAARSLLSHRQANCYFVENKSKHCSVTIKGVTADSKSKCPPASL